MRRTELEITEYPNTFECNHGGYVWNRLKPTKTVDGKMINMPTELKKLLKEERL